MASTSEKVRPVEDLAYEPQENKDVLSYTEVFPELPHAHPVEGTQWPAKTPAAWKTNVRPSKCTQVFTVPLEERRFKEMNEHSFGDEGQTEQAKICKDIMARHDVSIEISLSKDQSLTVVITGREQSVLKARREVLGKLQTQASDTVKIPREYHRFILGKNGKKLQQLENETATKITIPRADEKLDGIKIVGPKEGIERARHEIQIIADEQAKLAFERLQIPHIYHPFICGPNNTLVDKLKEETGAKIHIPPSVLNKDEIVVSGDKDGVMRAKETIMKIYQEKKRKCQTVSVEVRKSQHKYIIGPKGSGIQEILHATAVSVEVPTQDSVETITLRGEQDKLGPALTMVYSKANSVVFAEVDAPAWLHRYVIGKQGANVKKITQDFPKVHIEFTEGQNKIQIEGPPEEVDDAVKALEAIVRDLKKRMDFTEVNIDQKFHKHIIGKNGQNITRIKNDTGCAIKIPSDAENSNIIRIEGDPKGVAQAKQELLEMAKRMENEKTRDIIIEQRFHRTIIGAKGEKIREIKDKFNQVQVTFPDPGKKSDIVTLRGPKNDVDKCYKHLQNLQQELVQSSYQAQVHIFKDFHKNIIGKGGATIRKIREETDTKIDLPSENSDSDVIVITGKKANVEQAKAKIEAIQKELANIKEITVDIPHKFHNSIIGSKGKLIRSIMEENGGVIIRFPQEGSTQDKVTIRGPKSDVENAKAQLLEIANEKQTSGFTAEVKAKPEYHRFLIGKNGSSIRKVREKTGARVIFPSSDDPDQETITIIGKKESVEEAKKELESLIKNLDNVVEGEMQVDPKHHRYFVARRGEVLKHIADEFGGVTVSFPRSGVKSDRVVIKGSKDCVEGAKKRIQEIVNDLDSQVTVECVIPQTYHRTVMGTRGANVQDICKTYDVGIKFPDRPMPNGDNHSNGMINGEVDETSPKDAKKCDTIILTGKQENCDKAKEALLALVPITEETSVPYDFHRRIIGQQGKEVRSMMKQFDVNISIPPPEEHSDKVKVTGPPTNVRNAIKALQKKCEQLEQEKEEKILKGFTITVPVDSQYHSKIIGRRGDRVKKIREDHDVIIQFPREQDEDQNSITITGYEKDVEAAKETILNIVREYEEMVTVECNVDHRVHPRIIGLRGRNIRKIMDNFKVDVRFPRPSDDNPDLILISGDEDNCLECRDELLNLEEEYLQDVIDKQMLEEMTRPPKYHEEEKRASNKSAGFVVAGAPWDKPPDTSSTEDFPSMGASTVAPKVNTAWGSNRFGKR
ncbi:vigilin-like [Saccostrea echinata]|uniref:vigilin-like n=1 Tax=Saccostrea echinata TaxID=191078 RepID=UPI002A804E88|nr:vigilin-like [Saccostrea echinata]